jgi:hypothetical protein
VANRRFGPRAEGAATGATRWIGVQPLRWIAFAFALLFASPVWAAPAVLTAAASERERSQLPEPIRAWLYNEQVLLSRSVDTERIHPVTENMQKKNLAPEAARVFKLRTYWVDADKFDSFEAKSIDPEIRDLFVRKRAGRTQLRLVVHPESESFYEALTTGATPGDDLHASATASSRTVLAWKPGSASRPFFAKLSLNAQIGGVVRTIPKGEVARSVGVTRILEGEQGLPASFSYLPEVLGAMPKGFERGGMIVRQIPDEILRGEKRYVPLFSLYADPPDGSPTMLAEMVKKSGQSTQDFVRLRIIRPFVAEWLDLLAHHGITTEPHGQNVLIEIGQDGLPTGNFLHRDFGGFNVNFDAREKLGLGPDRRALPRIGDFDASWHTSKSEETKEHLETYFGGGVLFNLDQRFAPRQRGTRTSEPGLGVFESMMHDELRARATAMTGKRRFDGLVDAMTAAQEHELEKRASPPPAARAAGGPRKAPPAPREAPVRGVARAAGARR